MSKDELSHYLTARDHLVSGESFELLYDEKLDMLRTDPAPDADDLPRYYESDAYISHTDSGKGLMAFLYQLVKRRALRKKVKLIRKYNGGVGSLLDVGAGTGAFLDAAKRSGWKTSGTEPNPGARKMAGERGVNLKKSIDDFSGQQFDVVTLWHVLEHIPNLEKTVSLLVNLLKPGGSLVIAVPNFKSYDALHYKDFWAAYDVPRHLWHFSRNSIQRLFRGELIYEGDYPMLFDSFYVALLSEKYKNNRSFSLKAFWVGLLSNLKGISTKEYSSHIYVLKKKN